MGNSLFAPLATITAALIGGIIALLSIVLSKENKLSDFRQSWIDALRQEIALLVSNLFLLRKFTSETDPSPKESEDARRALLDADRALVLIKLRLNEREDASSNLLATLKEIEAFSNQPTHPMEQMDRLELDLINYSKTLLKSEWKRVKDGEQTYRFVRKASIGLVLALGLILISTSIISLRNGLNCKDGGVSIPLSVPSKAPLVAK